ncbi:MAG: hypothetical protein ABIM50_01265 [Novosphingobium sp.]
MTTRHLVDPELQGGIDLFPVLDLAASDIAELRTGTTAVLPPTETYARADVSIERVMVPGPAGAPDVPVNRRLRTS